MFLEKNTKLLKMLMKNWKKKKVVEDFVIFFLLLLLDLSLKESLSEPGRTVFAQVLLPRHLLEGGTQ